MLNENEKYRYSRHILLNEIGMEGQEKFKSAKVLVIGAGGLGCPVLQYLVAAGVGTIGVIDFDKVDETNLQRQILFTVDDIGKNKAEIAKERLEQLNPFVKITAYPTALTTKNALELFKQYDIVADGTDNFATRYLVNDACVITGKPLVYASIYKFEGQVSVFNYQNGPSYRCLFPEPPKAGSVPNCSEIGVLGVLPGLIGTQQANEVLKIILGIGEVLSGRLQIYNSLSSKTTELKINKSADEIEKVLSSKNSFESFDYEFFCGVEKNNNAISEIDSIELNNFNEAEIQLVDVRESWEQPKIELDNVLNAPLDDIDDYIEEISKTKTVIVVCQSGGRSKLAIEYLSKEHGYENLINLKGGVLGWKK